jgi:predicted Zn-dependent peptidase
MNRTQAPAVKIADRINIPHTDEMVLSNGIKVYGIPSDQGVIKVDFVFDAGKWFEHKNLVADFANKLMREGTKQKSSLAINEILDFYGCNLEEQSYFSNAGFQLYSLSRNIHQVLPLMKEMLTEASFPESEFELLRSNRKEKHLQRLAKNDYLANRLFLSNMWGKSHPYGRVTELENFDEMQVTDVSDFFYQHYHAGNCFIVLAGSYTDAILKQLEELFGSSDWKKQPSTPILHQRDMGHQLILHQEKENAVQTSLMVGNATITKTHPDFDALTIVNTILGGYFGSRLMANIREEKGYTYGVYSSLSAYQQGAIFEISADVGKEHKEATFHEIKKEMQRLQTELVDAEELQTVKNYMSGRILRSVDGALRYADVLKGLLLFNRAPESINSYLTAIQTIEAEQIRNLAQQYLQFDEMYKVSVG